MSSVKKGLALIIANADYQSQPQLPSCHKDGTDMKAKLEQLNFDVLYYTNTTRKTILEAISEFRIPLIIAPKPSTSSPRPKFREKAQFKRTICTRNKPRYATFIRLRARYKFASANSVQQC